MSKKVKPRIKVVQRTSLRMFFYTGITCPFLIKTLPFTEKKPEQAA